jgi:hypothetical protein
MCNVNNTNVLEHKIVVFSLVATDYSHITLEVGMVMKKASGGDSPLWQGAGKSFWTLLISHRRWWWLAVCFMEN